MPGLSSVFTTLATIVFLLSHGMAHAAPKRLDCVLTQFNQGNQSAAMTEHVELSLAYDEAEKTVFIYRPDNNRFEALKSVNINAGEIAGYDAGAPPYLRYRIQRSDGHLDARAAPDRGVQTIHSGYCADSTKPLPPLPRPL